MAAKKVTVLDFINDEDNDFGNNRWQPYRFKMNKDGVKIWPVIQLANGETYSPKWEDWARLSKKEMKERQDIVKTDPSLKHMLINATGNVNCLDIDNEASSIEFSDIIKK